MTKDEIRDDLLRKTDIIAEVLSKRDCELRALRDGVSVVALKKEVVAK